MNKILINVVAMLCLVTSSNVRAYDLNYDGFDDIVISNGWYTTNSCIYWGNPDGIYSTTDRTQLPTKSARGNAIGDLNGDGYLDIVFANQYDDIQVTHSLNSYIYWGNPSGYSVINRSYLPTHGAYGVTIGDINYDGNLDIVFSNNAQGGNKNLNYEINSYVYWGSPGGSYSSANRTELPTIGAQGNAVADFNGDGRFDIFFCNSESDYSYIYWGNPDASFSANNRTEIYSHQRNATTIADLNNDDYPDIIIGERIYYGNASGTYPTGSATVLESSNQIKENAVSDLNHDGYLDIVISYFKENTTFSTGYERYSYIYWGDASYQYSTDNMTALSTKGAHGVVISDVDNDGWEDIIFANNRVDPASSSSYYITDSYTYYNLNGTFPSSSRGFLPTIGATGVSAGDMISYGQFYNPTSIPEPLTIVLCLLSSSFIIITKHSEIKEVKQ